MLTKSVTSVCAFATAKIKGRLRSMQKVSCPFFLFPKKIKNCPFFPLMASHHAGNCWGHLHTKQEQLLDRK
jgi:hypothetical protein